KTGTAGMVERGLVGSKTCLDIAQREIEIAALVADLGQVLWFSICCLLGVVERFERPLVVIGQAKPGGKAY
ncbi:MAG: hypothetical protein P8Q36_08020, partial [Alphaproteobacteria bacterium]|nr:hypothetical protein [Alphaproteobacteria bacterium]